MELPNEAWQTNDNLITCKLLVLDVNTWNRVKANDYY